MKKPDFTAIALVRLLDALGIGASDQAVWSWGPYHPWDAASGAKPEWCRWGTRGGFRSDFMADLPRLRRMNRSQEFGGHDCSVFMQVPAGIVYIDDMTAAGVEALRARGVAPRAVIETSTGSYQVHLRVPRNISAADIYVAVQVEYGGDPGAHPAADGLQTRLARLPGFRNTKPTRAGAWVTCRHTTRSENADSEIAIRELALMGRQQKHITAAPKGAGAEGTQRRRSSPAAPLTGAYSGGQDNSPSGEDMRIAVRMAASGAQVEEIALAIQERRIARGKQARDASRNARKTAEKAIAYVAVRGGQRRSSTF